MPAALLRLFRGLFVFVRLVSLHLHDEVIRLPITGVNSGRKRAFILEVGKSSHMEWLSRVWASLILEFPGIRWTKV
jgi:hypothetical protein